MNKDSGLTESQRARGQRFAMTAQLPIMFIMTVFQGPVLMLIASDVLALSTLQIASALAWMPLLWFVTPFLYPWARKCSKVKWMMFCDFACVILFTIMWLRPAKDTTYLIFLVFLGGYQLFSLLGQGLMWQPILRDITTNKDRGRFFSKMRFGFMLFNFIMIYFLSDWTERLGGDMNETQYKFLLSVCIFGMISRVVWSYFIPEVDKPVQDESSKWKWSELKKILRESKLLKRPLFLIILLQIQMDSLFILFLKRGLDYPSKDVADLINYIILGQMLSMLLWGMLLDRIGHRPLIRIQMALAFCAIPLAFLITTSNVESSLVNSSVLFLGIGILRGVFFAGINLSMTSLLHFYTRPQHSVIEMTLLMAVLYLFSSLEKIISGWIVDTVEHEGTYMVLFDIFHIDAYRTYLLLIGLCIPLFVFFYVKKIENSKDSSKLDQTISPKKLAQ